MMEQTDATPAKKNGQQMLSNLLAIAYHVLEETKDDPSDASAVPDAESPQDEAYPDVNGLTAGFAGMHAHGQGHTIVIPYSPEEIQDTYTKIAALKNQYMKISADLLKAVKEVEIESGPEQEDKEVYERNVVMKGLIDRLRNLQHSTRLMKGGSAYPPNIVMESV
ncbi:hypothetical protein BBJ29_000727 [Phytophthora kernoviae]|uniref:Uncharacterized protein n=1 Tax=Phytophthora kernoviae TaxID=325452 RepID=A0A3F2S2Q4_9STRA|nr:hypothetical protein BBP00_00000613 [Phytophthora kernoviae]RLN71517.1 hypothetical protein BBJ29_000727 [Phytophthora kernoviae]